MADSRDLPPKRRSCPPTRSISIPPRRQVFAGIFVGYAAYYLVRNTLALAIPDILRGIPEYSKPRSARR